MRDYDTWKLSSGQDGERVFCNCHHCDGEIYVGEEYYLIEDDRVHEGCLAEYAKDHIAERMVAMV